MAVLSRSMAADSALIRHLRRELRAAADPVRAPQMRAYMKSTMPYYGIASTPLRAICRGVFDAHPLPSFEAWRDTVLELWRGASHREERYAAVALTGHRLYSEYQVLEALPVYEEMVVTGAWWDLVDGVATGRLRGLLERYPREMRRAMLAWSRSEDMWKRRAAILCQVGRRLDVDTDLLQRCIAPNLGDREFFIRKAIGWALRDYAWHDPAWVRQYVSQNVSKLSSLSRREASKNLDKALTKVSRGAHTMSASSTPGKPGRSPDSSAS